MKRWDDEDTIADLRGVHEMRRIKPCALCKGLGIEGSGMFEVNPPLVRRGPRRKAEFAHARCYARQHGEPSLLMLLPTQRDAVRLNDISAKGMRALLEVPRRCPLSGCRRKAGAKLNLCYFHDREFRRTV